MVYKLIMYVQKRRWIYHPLIWVAYILFAAIQDLAFHPFLFHNITNGAFICLGLATLTYCNAYYLIPTYLLRKKYLKYGLIVALIMVPNVFLVSLALTFFVTSYFSTVTGIVIIASDFVFVLTISTAIKLLQAWYRKERYSRELERRNLETELNYLKAQINPHFLFNTLNSIYFSIVKKPDLAQEIVLQLSDMLSHQLYDARKSQVPLSKELDYLEKYIQLESIRQGEIVQVDYSFPRVSPKIMISPLLLLPLVENAFKHGNKTQAGGYWINIQVRVQQKELFFSIENSFDPQTTKTQRKNSGIGLENVSRRLKLIYPERHHFECLQRISAPWQTLAEEVQLTLPEHVFSVNLQMKLAYEND